MSGNDFVWAAIEAELALLHEVRRAARAYLDVFLAPCPPHSERPPSVNELMRLKAAVEASESTP